MTIEGGTAIVLTYVLVSIGVIIAFLLAAFVIGWFIGRLCERRPGQRGEEFSPRRASCVRPPPQEGFRREASISAWLRF